MEGVMVTILADNYFGYCKKEVKTQIGYSANLFGMAEEEHAGGALAFPTFSLGDRFVPEQVRIVSASHRFAEVRALLGARAKFHDSGYATDTIYPEIHYMPEDMEIDVHRQDITWTSKGEEQHLKLLPGRIYIHPSGYKVRMSKHRAAPSWRLIGTVPEGAFCHKPCTVSGGGKSEISKSLVDAVLPGPFYVRSFEDDMDLVQAIFDRANDDALLPDVRPASGRGPSRHILSPDRSLGSVIKLLTPSPDEFTPEYNAWLESIPNYVRALVFVIKRFYRPEWGDDWRSHFSVDIINGAPGHELKYEGRRLVASYLRVGREENGAWRTYKLRQDFCRGRQGADGGRHHGLRGRARASAGRPPGEYDGHPSLKLAENCEYRLFQRPDDADPSRPRQADRGRHGRPGHLLLQLRAAHASRCAAPSSRTSRVHGLHAADARARGSERGSRGRWLLRLLGPARASSMASRPRIRATCSCAPTSPTRATGTSRRWRRGSAAGSRSTSPSSFPWSASSSGRRNNPPGRKAVSAPLGVYRPIHYQELPELFMDFVCSLTGKSPSTTGAGSEGASRRARSTPWPPTADLNNALVSLLLTGYGGFSYGRRLHRAAVPRRSRYQPADSRDLVPAVPSRARPQAVLIEAGHLEKLEDFEFDGKKVLASRLGYRITAKFVHTFFGRVFDNPTAVFTEEILKPEAQDPAVFADGVDNIVEAQQRVAEAYFADGSVDDACPPLKALLHIMAYGDYEGKDAGHPDIRGLFSREALLGSDWYRERLAVKQKRDVALWERHVRSLTEFLSRAGHREEAERLGIPGRLERARAELDRVSAPEYRTSLVGTIGADPIHRPPLESWNGGSGDCGITPADGGRGLVSPEPHHDHHGREEKSRQRQEAPGKAPRPLFHLAQ